VKKTSIHVRRYADPQAVGGWELTVEPEDRSFVLFVPTEGAPVLFLRVEELVSDETEHRYQAVG
jgi:hypothetical protein